MSNNERKIRIALSIALILAIVWAAAKLDAIADNTKQLVAAEYSPLK